jgi:hypothetical protein
MCDNAVGLFCRRRPRRRVKRSRRLYLSLAITYSCRVAEGQGSRGALIGCIGAVVAAIIGAVATVGAAIISNPTEKSPSSDRTSVATATAASTVEPDDADRRRTGPPSGDVEVDTVALMPAGARLDISPRQPIPLGDQLVVRGVSFPPRAYLRVKVNDFFYDSITTGNNGNFTLTSRVVDQEHCDASPATLAFESGGRDIAVVEVRFCE